MEREKGREKRTFYQSIVDEKKSIESPEFYQNKTFSYLDRGYYSKQIQNIYKFFNKSQLLVLRSEDLRKDPDIILKSISKFLSIPAFKPVVHKEVNSRFYPFEMSNDELSFLKTFYAQEFIKLENILGWDLSNWRMSNER